MAGKRTRLLYESFEVMDKQRSTREQIVEAMMELIERQGYHATGLNEIVKESGAPKGSLYYYFPEGKEQITAEAIKSAGQRITARIAESLQGGEDPAEAVRQFVQTIAYHVEASGFCSGGPLQTVALETATTSERLNGACREAYDLLQGAFREKFLATGFLAEQAARLGLFVTTTIEGAIVLSRTYHSGDPLLLAAEFLAETIQREKQKQRKEEET